MNNLIQYKESMNNFLVELIKIIDKNKNSLISIIAKYEDMNNILSDILFYYKFDIKVMDFSDMEINGYDKEYLLEVQNGEIFIEPLWSTYNKNYIMTDTDIIILVNIDNNELLRSQEYEIGFNVNIIDEESKEERSLLSLDEMLINAENQKKIEESNKNIIKENKEEKYIELSKTENGTLKGFSISGGTNNSYWSKSFYSTDENLVKKTLESWT